ncbi:unnamed protein product [Durusdinium trenchii]|uniref:Uncharacterized protein n=1 Tax=Durusdinium trenchii TaxID=1381693 RepID=A0ABP0N0Y9_9DINO
MAIESHIKTMLANDIQLSAASSEALDEMTLTDSKRWSIARCMLAAGCGALSGLVSSLGFAAALFSPASIAAISAGAFLAAAGGAALLFGLSEEVIEEVSKDYVKQCFEAIYEQQSKRVHTWVKQEFACLITHYSEEVQERKKQVEEFQASADDGLVPAGFEEDVKALMADFFALKEQALALAKKASVE